MILQFLTTFWHFSNPILPSHRDAVSESHSLMQGLIFFYKAKKCEMEDSSYTMLRKFESLIVSSEAPLWSMSKTEPEAVSKAVELTVDLI